MSEPSITPPPSLADQRSRSWPGFAVGIAATVAIVVAVVNLWPDSDPPRAVTTDESHFFPDVTSGTVAGLPGQPGVPTPEDPVGPTTTVSLDLFAGGAPEAVAAVLAAAGDPSQLFELAIYPSYLFVAYRDPADPGHIDRREWRGKVSTAEPNIIDDRVDSDSEPKLFTPAEVDLTRLVALVTDAPTHYDIPTKVTHILIDRFLPFDQRVLVRVYSTPVDGRSGGGYVSYTIDGSVVRVCC